MRSVTMSAIAGAAILISLPAARAADMPAPMMYQAPAEDFGGWYLRGDIGMSNQKAKLFHPAFNERPYTHVDDSFGSAPIFGIGVGYQFNNWLRVDVTGEYRGGANYQGLGVYPTGADDYRARKSEWVGMVNAYADLGTWWCVTPFVGVGIGAAYNTISSFVDVDPGPANSLYYAEEKSKMNFAWALHAGLAYKVTPGFTVELAYRYLDLGKAATGPGATYDGAVTNGRPFEFNNLVSHDLKLGVRWALEPEVTPMPRPMQLPPLMRKG